MEVRAVRQPDGSYLPGLLGTFDGSRELPDGTKVHLWWLRAKSLPECSPALQKVSSLPTKLRATNVTYVCIVQCILAYMSDIKLLAPVLLA